MFGMSCMSKHSCLLCEPTHWQHVHDDMHHCVTMSYFAALMRINDPEKQQFTNLFPGTTHCDLTSFCTEHLVYCW